MTDAEIIQYHEKAVADCNRLLEALAEIWLTCNTALQTAASAGWPLEARNHLVRCRTVASEATRQVMIPVQPRKGE